MKISAFGCDSAACFVELYIFITISRVPKKAFVVPKKEVVSLGSILAMYDNTTCTIILCTIDRSIPIDDHSPASYYTYESLAR